MDILVKKQIRSIVKRKGSHIGVVKNIITTSNTEIDFEDYREYTEALIEKKMKNTESKIRASIRYQ